MLICAGQSWQRRNDKHGKLIVTKLPGGHKAEKDKKKDTTKGQKVSERCLKAENESSPLVRDLDLKKWIT